MMAGTTRRLHTRHMDLPAITQMAPVCSCPRRSNRIDYCVPALRLSTVARRTFPVAGARIWNDLPSDVTSSPSTIR